MNRKNLIKVRVPYNSERQVIEFYCRIDEVSDVAIARRDGSVLLRAGGGVITSYWPTFEIPKPAVVRLAQDLRISADTMNVVSSMSNRELVKFLLRKECENIEDARAALGIIKETEQEN